MKLEIRILNADEEGPTFPEIKEYKYAPITIASIIEDGVIREDGEKTPSILLGGPVQGGEFDGMYLCLELTHNQLEILYGASLGVLQRRDNV